MNYEGVIGEIDLIQRLVELGREQFTGAIRFENDGVIKIVYFKGGDVLSASTNDRTDSIDEILLRAGKVSRDHVKQALAKRKESETLGDALLGLGFITRKELTWARRVQVIGILRSVVTWAGGAYAIVPDYLPKREEGTIFPLNQIVVELIVTDPDRAKFEQVTESGTAVYVKTASFEDGFRKLGLNEDAEQIVAQIDGERTAAEIAGVSGKDTFNVYKLLEALRVLGIVEKHDAAMTFDDFAKVGAADAADAWSMDEEPAPVAAVPAPPAPAMPAWDPVPTAPAVSARSVWDEPDETLAAQPDTTVEMPVEEHRSGSDAQWGFDEAQIEAARRASVPVRGKGEKTSAPPSVTASGRAARRSSPVLMILLVLVVLGAGGWFGWTWWQGRTVHAEASAAPPAPVKRAALRPRPVTETTTAPAPTTTTATTTMAPTITDTTDTSKPLPPVQRKTASPIVIRPTPAPAPTPVPMPVHPVTPAPVQASGNVAQKYAAMAREYAAQKSGAYTVQFELVCETASVTKALRDGGDKIWFAPITYRGRDCYRVFWGRYDTKGAAEAAAKSVPKSLGGSGVVVKIP
jgi:hypothetical protein